MKKKKRDWSKVIEELCCCGHKRSQHGGDLHHLECLQCECTRFTWKAFLNKQGKVI